MSVRVRIERAAELQAEDLADWWNTNRTSARPLKQLLREAFQRIGDNPFAPPVFERVDDTDVRRVALKTTPYHVYYVVDDVTNEAIVIAVWSGRHGRGPVLRTSGKSR